MSLTRYLPTPSDRMGILHALANIPDAIILEYSSAGTTSYFKKLVGRTEIDLENRLFATHLTEDDIVMGDTSKLEEAIKTLDKTFQPKFIFVMSSSVTSIIGSDVKGVCSFLEEEVEAKIVVFEQGGFSGDYSSGLEIATTKLIKELATVENEPTPTYNVIGLNPMLSNTKADRKAIANLMMESLGLKENSTLFQGATLDDIENMSKAQLNLVMSYEGLQAAKILEQRFGTPYVYGVPVGHKKTTEWLREISEKVDREVQPQLLAKYEAVVEQTGKVAIYTDFSRAKALKDFFTEMGMEVVFCICPHSFKKVKEDKADMVYYKTESERLKQFEDLENTVVLGDAYLVNHADETNSIMTIYRLYLGSGEAEQSLLGYEGAEKLITFLDTHKN